MFLIWGKSRLLLSDGYTCLWTSRVAFGAFVCVHCEGGGFACTWRPWTSSKDSGRGLEQESHCGLLTAVTPPSTSTALLFPTERVCTTVLGL